MNTLDYIPNERSEKLEAVHLIDTHIAGRKPDDFEMFNAKERHFLFSMRNKLKIARECAAAPVLAFDISRKQFNYLKDLMARLDRVSKIAYLKKCIPNSKREVTHLKKQLKDAEALLAEQEEELAIVSKVKKGKS